MWDLFRAGIEPVSLELQDGFLTTGRTTSGACMWLFLWKMLCRRESQRPQFRTTRCLGGNMNDQVLFAGRKPGARGLRHQPRQAESRAVHQWDPTTPYPWPQRHSHLCLATLLACLLEGGTMWGRREGRWPFRKWRALRFTVSCPQLAGLVEQNAEAPQVSRLEPRCFPESDFQRQALCSLSVHACSVMSNSLRPHGL